jgi:hypothetical protein
VEDTTAGGCAGVATVGISGAGVATVRAVEDTVTGRCEEGSTGGSTGAGFATVRASDTAAGPVCEDGVVVGAGATTVGCPAAAGNGAGSGSGMIGVPHLKQNLASGWFCAPHLMQNIAASSRADAPEPLPHRSSAGRALSVQSALTNAQDDHHEPQHQQAQEHYEPAPIDLHAGVVHDRKGRKDCKPAEQCSTNTEEDEKRRNARVAVADRSAPAEWAPEKTPSRDPWRRDCGW